MLLQVSYHDVPDRAYETFVSALTSKYLEQGLVIPSLVDVHNPAGTCSRTRNNIITLGVVLIMTSPELVPG